MVNFTDRNMSSLGKEVTEGGTHFYTCSAGEGTEEEGESSRSRSSSPGAATPRGWICNGKKRYHP